MSAQPTEPTPPPSPPTTTSDIIQYTLDNGLNVVIKPVHAAPVVALNVWVHVGSKDETDETRGLAHIQEHMLFQGTESYPGLGEISQIIEGVGGSFNAYTSYDQTVYHITMPAENMGTGLKILSSMMTEATMEPAALTNELAVVMEEFRRRKDNPGTILTEAIFDAAYDTHPYGHPIIGYQPTIENISREQIQAFYKDWYIPENMTVVVVGDIDPDATKEEIATLFGEMPSHTNPKHTLEAEPKQTAARAMVLHEPFENTQLAMGYQLVQFEHPDAPALDVLFFVLGTGKSSRLYRSLVEQKQLATGINATPYTPEDAGLALFQLKLKPEQIEPALQELLAQLEAVKAAPVTEAELTKAKVLMESRTVYDQESYGGIARKLGWHRMIEGDANGETAYLKKVLAVTPADIQRVAQTYLTPETLTIGVLYPEEVEGLSEEQLLSIVTAPVEPGQPPVAPETATVAVASVTEDVSSLVTEREFDEASNVTKAKLQNGIAVLLREDPSVPSFNVQLINLGGLRYETKANNGINQLVANMITRGTETRTHEQITETLEGMAAGISGFAGNNSIGLSATGLSRHRAEVLTLLADISQNATYPTDQLELIRSLTLDAIERQEDNPATQAMQFFRSTLYGDHPFGMRALGTKETVSTFTAEDLKAYAAQVLRPEGLVITVVGDIKTDETLEQIISDFGSWRTEVDPVVAQNDAPDFPTEITTTYHEDDRAQSNILLGFPGIALDHPDRYPFAILNKILSGAGGRLFAELRDRRPLAYSVGGRRILGYQEPGFYAVYIGTTPENTEAAIDGIIVELQKLIYEAPDEDELKRAQDYLAGTFVVGLQSFSAQAQTLAFDELYGLGFNDYLTYADDIRAVSAADIQRIAEEYLTLDRYVLSVVGPVNPRD